MDSIFDMRTRQWEASKGSWMIYSFKESYPYIRNQFLKIGKPAPIEEHGKACFCQGCHLESLKQGAKKFQKV